MSTDLDNPPRCPRCGSHDLLLLSVANGARDQLRVIVQCDACSTHYLERIGAEAA